MRVGSQVGAILEQCLSGESRPFGLEVVGDPNDTFSPGAMRNPLRPVFRRWFTRQLRRQCRRACSVAYVTRTALQRRYPAAEGVFQTHYSSIELDSVAFVSTPRGPIEGSRPIRLITVGTLEQLYKAPDVLLDAVALGVRRGHPLTLRVLGDGQYREVLVSAQPGSDSGRMSRSWGTSRGERLFASSWIKPTCLFCHLAKRVCHGR